MIDVTLFGGGGVLVEGLMLPVMVSQDGLTALLLASDSGHDSTAAVLLDRGADIEARSNVSVSQSDVWVSVRKGDCKHCE